MFLAHNAQYLRRLHILEPTVIPRCNMRNKLCWNLLRCPSTNDYIKFSPPQNSTFRSADFRDNEWRSRYLEQRKERKGLTRFNRSHFIATQARGQSAFRRQNSRRRYKWNHGCTRSKSPSHWIFHLGRCCGRNQ